MDLSDVLGAGAKDPLTRELHLHQFIDQIRSATMSERKSSISIGEAVNNRWTVVVAAAIESICLEFHESIPSWTAVKSDHPIFIPEVKGDSRGAAYLKSVSPEPFRRRHVVAPDIYLSCA